MLCGVDRNIILYRNNKRNKYFSQIRENSADLVELTVLKLSVATVSHEARLNGRDNSKKVALENLENISRVNRTIIGTLLVIGILRKPAFLCDQ